MNATRVGPRGRLPGALVLAGPIVLLLPTAAALEMDLESFLLPDEPLEIRLDFDGQSSLAFTWSTQPGQAHFSIHAVDEPPQPDDFEGPNDQGTGSVRPTQPGGYTFQWVSAHPDTQRIRVMLQGDAVFVDARGVHQIDPVEYAPGPPLGLALLALLGILGVMPRRR